MQLHSRTGDRYAYGNAVALQSDTGHLCIVDMYCFAFCFQKIGGIFDENDCY